MTDLFSFIDPAFLEQLLSLVVALAGAGFALSAIPGAVGYAVFFIVAVLKED